MRTCLASIALLLVALPLGAQQGKGSGTIEVNLRLLEWDHQGDPSTLSAVSILVREGGSTSFTSHTVSAEVTVTRRKGRLWLEVAVKDLDGVQPSLKKEGFLAPTEAWNIPRGRFVLKVKALPSGTGLPVQDGSHSLRMSHANRLRR